MTSLRLFASRLIATLSVTVFVVLVVDVLWGVFTRYALGQQASWSEEIARLLLVWLSMLGTALAYGERSHLGVDVLLKALTGPARWIATLAIYLLVLAFSVGVMVYGGTSLFLERLDAGQVMSTLPIYKAWMYFAIPVSGIMMTIFAVDDIRLTLRQAIDGDAAVESR